MDEDLLPAIAWFPHRARAIRELAGTDESFRALCLDLRDAQTALARWEQSFVQARQERCSEYRELATELAEEIRAVLDRRTSQ